MQAEEIIRLMNRQTSFSEETLEDLRNLVEEYPYFQAAQLLYTLNLHANKDTRFNAELRKAACYAGDRKNLFFRIEEEFFSPEKLERLEKNEEEKINSSFDLIDFFLAGKEEKRKGEVKKTTGSPIASTDYISCFLAGEAQAQEIEVQPMQHQQTIDKFLEEDGKSPIRIDLKEKDKAVEDAFPNFEKETEESFFSVTLAKIYLKQKKYEKALEIIRKLNLIYPEKSLYFADQIRFLEKLIINTKK
jgi:hypothetical protein